MQVQSGRRQILMPENFLKRFQTTTPANHIRRGLMAQQVWIEPFPDPGASRYDFDAQPSGRTREWPAAVGQKDT